MLNKILRKPLRIFSYLYGLFLSRHVISDKFMPIVLDSPEVGLTIIKGKDAKIIINGRLIVDKRGTPGPIKGPLIEVQEGAVLTINNNVLLAPNTHIQVNKGGEITIGERDDTITAFAYGCKIGAAQSIRIGSGCWISWDVLIMDSAGHPINGEIKISPISIGNHVLVTAKAIILKGVEIGEGSIIATGAVVTKIVPPGSLVAGNPAKVIRTGISWEA